MLVLHDIAVKCLRTLSGLFSPNLIDQSSCKMGLVLACVVRTLQDDWPIRLGENRPGQSSQTFGGYAVLHTEQGCTRVEKTFSFLGTYVSTYIMCLSTICLLFYYL